MPPDTNASSAGTHKLDLRFFRHTLRLAAPFWFSAEKRKAWLLLLALIVLLVGYTEFSVLLNHESGELTSALAARDSSRFRQSILAFFGLLIVSVPTDALYVYVRDNLALHWRRWLTRRLLGRYFAQRGYYRLLSDAAIDNPDQRISDDVNSFTQQSLVFVLVFASAVFQLIAFGRVLIGARAK